MREQNSAGSFSKKRTELLQGWFLLCGTKIVLGYWLKGAAGAYLRHFERRQKKMAARTQVARNSVAGDITKLAKKE